MPMAPLFALLNRTVTTRAIHKSRTACRLRSIPGMCLTFLSGFMLPGDFEYPEWLELIGEMLRSRKAEPRIAAGWGGARPYFNKKNAGDTCRRFPGLWFSVS